MSFDFDDIATGYEVSVEVTAESGNVVAADLLRAAVRADGVVAGAIGDDWFSPFLDTYRVEMRDFLDSVEAAAASAAAPPRIACGVRSYHPRGCGAAARPSRCPG